MKMKKDTLLSARVALGVAKNRALTSVKILGVGGAAAAVIGCPSPTKETPAPVPPFHP